MSQAEAELVRELVELRVADRDAPLVERRRRFELAEAAFADHAPAPGRVVDAGGSPAEWTLAPRGRGQATILYLHGGSYALGSPRSHRHLAGAIGHAAGMAVLTPDYRRAPEHPFPAAVEDAVRTYRWLRETRAGPLAVVGDSAGGGLAIATMLALRAAGERLPGAAVCLSPWVDLTCPLISPGADARADPVLDHFDLEAMARGYLGAVDPRDPLASPVFGDLAGLPPLLIQVGTDEILLEDERRLMCAARDASVDVTLAEWTGMIHVWQWYFPVLSEARDAIDEIGRFLRARLQRSPGRKVG